ncbi:MAG TPA: ATPase, T2SS/T4P/T4SS family [Terriglobales bacterium]|nr:ATPase, T2SS/T4P/T4SS family [Terriglobales bacterium]
MSDDTDRNVPKDAAGQRNPTLDLIVAIFNASMQLTGTIPSDVILSPGRPPQLQVSGKLLPLNLHVLSPNDTARIANDLTLKNERALKRLAEEGSCEVAVSVPKMARLRPQIFRQRGTYVIAIRVGRTAIPDFASLTLPPQLADIANLEHGLVVVAGGPGSGKSSTMAALIDRINESCAYNIVTLENPVEFLHLHKKSLVHQRELYSDMPSYDLGMQSALRQGARVIMLSELADRRTAELALTAADSGRLIISSMETGDAVTTAERIVSFFPVEEQKRIRGLLSRSFRYLIAQQLLPGKNGGRVPIFEILKASSRARSLMDRGEDWSALTEAISKGNLEDVQTFEQELEKAIRKRLVSVEVGLRHSSRPDMLRLELADMRDESSPPQPE